MGHQNQDEENVGQMALFDYMVKVEKGLARIIIEKCYFVPKKWSKRPNFEQKNEDFAIQLFRTKVLPYLGLGAKNEKK